MIRLRSLSAVIARHCVASGLFAALLATAVLPAHAQTADEAARAAERAALEATPTHEMKGLLA